MELRQRRYFVTVAEEGNLNRAAKMSFLPQPAVSRQVKPLCLVGGHRAGRAEERLLAVCAEVLRPAGHSA